MANRFILQGKTIWTKLEKPSATILPSLVHVFASIQHEFHQLHVPFGRGVVKGSATCGVGRGTAGDVAVDPASLAHFLGLIGINRDF